MQSSPFSNIARVALDDIFKKHATTSKYGFFVTEEKYADFLEDLLNFIETSRSLRSKGDSFFGKQEAPPAAPSNSKSPAKKDPGALKLRSFS